MVLVCVCCSCGRSCVCVCLSLSVCVCACVNCSRLGLFLSLLLLSRSLGCVSTDVSGNTRRGVPTTTTSNHSPMADPPIREEGQDEEGEVWWEVSSSTPPRSRDSTGSAKRMSTKRGTGGGTGRSVMSDTAGARGRRGVSLGAPSTRRDVPAVWTNDRLGGRNSVGGMSSSRSLRSTSAALSIGSNTRQGGRWSHVDGVRDARSAPSLDIEWGGYRRSAEVSPLVQRYALCRSYVDTAIDELPLVECHPCSSGFFHFIIGWILLYHLFLLLVTCQNLFVFPEVLEALLGMHVNVSLGQGLYSFFTLFPTPIRLVWIVLIWKVRFHLTRFCAYCVYL